MSRLPMTGAYIRRPRAAGGRANRSSGHELPRAELSVDHGSTRRPNFLIGLAIALVAWPMTFLVALGLPRAALAVLLVTALALAARALRRRTARRRRADAQVTPVPRSSAAEPDRSVEPAADGSGDIAAHAARGLADLERWRRRGGP